MADSAQLYQDVTAHFAAVQQDPTTPLNDRLLHEAEIFLPPHLQHDTEQQRLQRLVAQLSALLPTLQQDPAPAVRLLQKLVSHFTFTDVLHLTPAVDFSAALDPAATPFHHLALSLLAKAARSPQDAAVLAGMPLVVLLLVRLWLTSADGSTAEAAQAVILDLFAVDKEHALPAARGGGGVGDGHHSLGQGLFWRRFFGDRDVYGLLFSCCSLGPRGDAALSKSARTLAQARLMAVVPRIGTLDWACLARKHHTDIESLYGGSTDDCGLLDYVSLRMVDYEDDVLIHMNLLQYYANLIETVREASINSPKTSLSLEYLKAQGLHTRAVSYYLPLSDAHHDPLDATYLYGPSAHYLSIYISLYPHDFLSSDSLANETLAHLCHALDISAGRWAHAQPPSHDLSVLASLPRAVLLPQSRLHGQFRHPSPLLLVPCKHTSVDALYTLARIFAGPASLRLAPVHEMTKVDGEWTLADTTSPTAADANDDYHAGAHAEAAAARACFIVYLHHHPTFFSDVVLHAETVALPQKALAALHLLSAIISATWAALPVTSTHKPGSTPTSPFALPAEPAFLAALPRVIDLPPAYAATGIEVVLQSPVREVVVTFLLRAPQVFSNLVGGLGDAESAAYKVAMAKWDVFRVFRERLQTLGGARGREAVLAAVQERLSDGPWGRREEVGGRIATMEL